MDWFALALAGGLCLAMATAEGVLSGNDLPRWLASLRQPRLYAPMWLWIAAAIVTYGLQGLVAYRLLRLPLEPVTAAALLGLVIVMSSNVAYNVVLARTQSPRVAYVGILWFLPALAVCQAALLVADPAGAAINMVYVTWVVAYDLPVMRALWRLNA